MDDVESFVSSDKMNTKIADIKNDLGSLLTMVVKWNIRYKPWPKKLSIWQIYIQRSTVIKSLELLITIYIKLYSYSSSLYYCSSLLTWSYKYCWLQSNKITWWVIYCYKWVMHALKNLFDSLKYMNNYSKQVLHLLS